MKKSFFLDKFWLNVTYAVLGSFVAPAALVILTGSSGSSDAQMLGQHFIEAPSGTRIGYTLDRGNRVEAYDRTGSRLGYYDRDDDFTYDRTGRRIAKGNILSALIVEHSDGRLQAH